MCPPPFSRSAGAILGRTDGWVAATGLAAAVMAIATVFPTGMIYASLKPVPQWHSPYTLPGYLIFALMTGAVLLNAVLHVFGPAERGGAPAWGHCHCSRLGVEGLGVET